MPTGGFLVKAGCKISLDQFLTLASEETPVRLSEEVRQVIMRSRRTVEDCLARGQPVYGLNTGLGAQVDRQIDQEAAEKRQISILLGRACGTGPLLERGVSRAALLARILSMAKGHSGIHPETFDRLLDFYNCGLAPCVPSIGSVGAGDLVANAHLALPLAGQGEVWRGNEPESAARALKERGLKACRLRVHDAMALVNHSSVTLAAAAMAASQARQCLREGLLAAAISFEGFAANTNVLIEEVNALRPAPGQVDAARLLRRILEGSETQPRRVQDPLSFRLAAVVFGASHHALGGAIDAVSAELNGAPDSPAVFAGTDTMCSTPNFFNPSIAQSLHLLGLALFDCARASVQRCQKLMTPELSGLPRCLSPAGGVSAGMIPLQKTANSLLAEIGAHSHVFAMPLPPVSESVEDLDCGGIQAARRLELLLGCLRELFAVEALAAAQAMDLRGSAGFAPVAARLRLRIREVSPMLDEDRPLSGDLRKAKSALQSFAQSRDIDRILQAD